MQTALRRNSSSLGVRFLIQSEKSPANLYARLSEFLAVQLVRGRRASLVKAGVEDEVCAVFG